MLVLRYVDAWASGEWLPVQLLAEYSAVGDAVNAVPADHQARALLSAVLERTTTEWGLRGGGEPYPKAPAARRVAAPLLAYAHALQFTSMWALAADAYLTVWDTCGPPGRNGTAGAADIDAAAIAALRLGACYRTLGDPTRAATAYGAAGAIARQRGDLRTELRAQLGEAKLIQERGNLPLADERIACVIRETITAQLRDVRAHAFHDRSTVAYHRGHYREAIEWGFEAWAIEQNPRERERVLADLATALFAAGYRELARDAHRLVAATAEEPFTRWLAAINLIEIATLERDEVEFNRCRRPLRSAALPPTLEAGYHYYVGLGELVFGHPERGTAALDRALAVAETHRLGEMVIKAEAARKNVRTDTEPARRTATAPLPPEFAYISDALRGAWAASHGA
jgi:tetratricopeptide (TPR) repeat protein